MWPFRKKAPAKTFEQIAAELPPAPCGRQVEHWRWIKLEGFACPTCAAFREAERKEMEQNALAEAIAVRVVEKLKMVSESQQKA